MILLIYTTDKQQSVAHPYKMMPSIKRLNKNLKYWEIKSESMYSLLKSKRKPRYKVTRLTIQEFFLHFRNKSLEEIPKSKKDVDFWRKFGYLRKNKKSKPPLKGRMKNAVKALKGETDVSD